jgi:hypothetical protein
MKLPKKTYDILIQDRKPERIGQTDYYRISDHDILIHKDTGYVVIPIKPRPAA